MSKTEENISCHQYNMSFSGITKLLNKKDKNKTKYNPSYDLIYSHNPLGKLVIIDMLNFIQIIRDIISQQKDDRT